MGNLLQEHISGKNGELQGAQNSLTWGTCSNCPRVSNTAPILVHAVVAGHYCYEYIALAVLGKRKNMYIALFFK